MVTGADAMVTGIGHWCWTRAMITGSLVDDGLDLWISGDWWMCSRCHAGTVSVPETVTFP